LKITQEYLIQSLELEPLLGEGGLYRNTYRSKAVVRDLKTGQERPAGTCIYYLLTRENFSHLHSLKGDEIYHFYLGDPVELLVLEPKGRQEIITLGQNLKEKMQVQYLVRAHAYQGLRLKPGGSFALLGTTMTPGYDQRDYTLGERDFLLKQWPAFEKEIKALTGPLIY